MKTIHWKVFFILWVAAIFSVILLLPYVLEIQSSAIDLTKLGLTLPAIVAIQVVQSAMLFAGMIFVGLLLAQRVGLGTPILDSMARGERVDSQVRAILPLSVALGVLVTLIVLGLEFFYFQPAIIEELGDRAAALNLQTSQPAAWKGLLASFYGGIAEEIALRLFGMSLLVWLGKFISRTPEGNPSNLVFWTANVLAAVLFGIGHLPTMSLLTPLTPLVVTRTIFLNALIGVVCGWMYWKRGLESAMLAHFSADLVLHVLLAL